MTTKYLNQEQVNALIDTVKANKNQYNVTKFAVDAIVDKINLKADLTTETSAKIYTKITSLLKEHSKELKDLEIPKEFFSSNVKSLEKLHTFLRAVFNKYIDLDTHSAVIIHNLNKAENNTLSSDALIACQTLGATHATIKRARDMKQARYGASTAAVQTSSSVQLLQALNCVEVTGEMRSKTPHYDVTLKAESKEAKAMLKNLLTSAERVIKENKKNKIAA